MTTIGAEEAGRRLEQLKGWELVGSAVRRQFVFATFPDAITFVVRVGFAAEAADHHPDVLISYRRITLTYTTHSAGGLTEKDFGGAQEASRIAEAWEGPGAR